MIKLTKYILVSFFMLEFPNHSFEPEKFKTGKSGKVYDLSFNGLGKISKEELVDILSNNYYGLDNIININNNRTFLLNILNKKLLELYKPCNIELFGLKDPRKRELTKKEKEKYKIESFPKHIGIGLPHGTYKLPKITRKLIIEEIEEKLKKKLNKNKFSKDVKNELKKELTKFYRILQNFSDHGTTNVVKESNLIPNNQIFAAKYSRGTTDPSRAISEKPMDTDFYGNKLKSSIKTSHAIGGYEYAILHIKIKRFINETIYKYGGSIFIDRHDTGVNNMNNNPKLDKYDIGGFPIISLGTLDGESCNSEILEYYTERIEYHLGVKPLINSPYKGGYITQKYGIEKRKEIEKKGLNKGINNVIQIEVLKSLYLDEKTQIVDKDKAEWIGIGLARAEIDLGLRFGKEYFNNLKK